MKECGACGFAPHAPIAKAFPIRSPPLPAARVEPATLSQALDLVGKLETDGVAKDVTLRLKIYP